MAVPPIKWYKKLQWKAEDMYRRLFPGENMALSVFEVASGKMHISSFPRKLTGTELVELLQKNGVLDPDRTDYIFENLPRMDAPISRLVKEGVTLRALSRSKYMEKLEAAVQKNRQERP